MRKNILWSNININEDDYVEIINEWLANSEREENFDTLDDYEKWSFIEDELNFDLEFLREELSFLQLDNPILVIGDLGRWDKRKQGYKIIKSCNIKDIFYSDCDYIEWYSDGYNIHCTGYHHDGTNYYEYREIKNMDNIDKLLDKIYNGEEISRSVLNYYTKSILPAIKKVYSW